MRRRSDGWRKAGDGIKARSNGERENGEAVSWLGRLVDGWLNKDGDIFEVARGHLSLKMYYRISTTSFSGLPVTHCDVCFDQPWDL